jgi:hypothetical protein
MTRELKLPSALMVILCLIVLFVGFSPVLEGNNVWRMA